MSRGSMITSALAISLAVQPISDASAAAYASRNFANPQARLVVPTQAPPNWHGRPAPRPGWRGGNQYPGWRGGPGWRGAAPWRGPPGWTGRPYWYGRPWAPRPYYGTIIAGVALGTLITVAAVGYVPPRPAPNLCWYWADPYGNRGYWDYCS